MLFTCGWISDLHLDFLGSYSNSKAVPTLHVLEGVEEEMCARILSNQQNDFLTEHRRHTAFILSLVLPQEARCWKMPTES